MKRVMGYTAVEILVVILVLGGIGGWIANIVKLIANLSDPITGMFILRAVGIFVAPLGAVLGFV